jgi:hypothetical protein
VDAAARWAVRLVSSRETLVEEEDFGAALKQVLGMSVAVQWWIGDMLAFGEKTYAELTAQLEGEYKRALKSLRQYRYVCKAVQASRRLDTLTFNHHEVVAPLSDVKQGKWIRVAWSKYCGSGRIEFSREHADRYIRASELRPKIGTHGSHVWTERQLRELAKCETDNDARCSFKLLF